MEDTISIQISAVRKQFVISLARPALPNGHTKPPSFQRTGVPNRCSVEHLSSNVHGVTARLSLDNDFVQGQLGSGHPRNYCADYH